MYKAHAIPHAARPCDTYGFMVPAFLCGWLLPSVSGRQNPCRTLEYRIPTYHAEISSANRISLHIMN